MFDGNSRVRRVDYSGARQTQKSRSDVLNEARLLRQKRQDEKDRVIASSRIQACYRSYRTRTHCKQLWRSNFDALLTEATTPTAANHQQQRWNGQRVHTMVRWFTAFYAPTVAADNIRLGRMCRIVLASAQQPDASLNCFQLLLLPPKNDEDCYDSSSSWRFQVQRLLRILLPHLFSNSNGDGRPSNELMLFWQLLDTAAWPWFVHLSQAQQTLMEQQQCEWLLHDCDACFRAFHHGLVVHLAATDSQAAAAAQCRLVLRVATRMVGLAVKCLPSAVESITSAFTAYILSIPLLKQRLLWTNLSAVANMLATPSFLSLCAQSVTPSMLQLVPTPTATITAVAAAAAADEQLDRKTPSPLTVSTTAAAAVMTTQQQQQQQPAPAVAYAPSYTPFDEQVHEHLAKFNSNNRSNGAGDAMDVDDEDSDDDDDTDATAVQRRQKRLPRAIPTSVYSYLWGNIMELLTDCGGTPAADVLQRVLPVLLEVIPACDFHVDAGDGTLTNPVYARQITLLSSGETIKLLMSASSDASDGSVAGLGRLAVTVDLMLWKLPHQYRMLTSIVYGTPLLQQLWECMRSRGPLMHHILNDISAPATTAIVSLFCIAYNHLLYLQDDEEFYTRGVPLSMDEVRVLIQFLNSLLYMRYCGEVDVSVPRIQRMYTYAVRTFQQLRDRHARRAICPPSYWLMDEANVVMKEMNTPTESERSRWLREEIAFVTPFESRVQLLYGLIANEKAVNQYNYFGRRQITIRRSHVLEDGFEQLGGVGSLKVPVAVVFRDEYGMVEHGVDGGGLFKEFLNLLLKAALDPDRGLFRETPDHLIYPSPLPPMLGNETLAIYKFIGQVLGKALYDGIIIEPQFALFFLKKMLGKTNSLHDLSTLDPELYRNIMFLKHYTGDIEEMGLSFSVDENVLGVDRKVNLIANGADVAVTAANKLQFIHHMADYKLNRQIRYQCRAFFDGMQTVIDLSWLKLFQADELSLLLSGSNRIDVADLRANTVYNNGYTEEHPVIQMFWDVVTEFTDQQRQDLLRFATSCSRAPLLGFASMRPKLCIQQMFGNQEALPTASTCYNLIRLPDYPNRELMRSKLLYAVEQCGTGFALS